MWVNRPLQVDQLGQLRCLRIYILNTVSPCQ